MYKLLGGANIFLRYQTVVYSKNITASGTAAKNLYCVGK
jgi:hypothetical protein